MNIEHCATGRKKEGKKCHEQNSSTCFIAYVFLYWFFAKSFCFHLHSDFDLILILSEEKVSENFVHHYFDSGTQFIFIRLFDNNEKKRFNLCRQIIANLWKFNRNDHKTLGLRRHQICAFDHQLWHVTLRTKDLFAMRFGMISDWNQFVTIRFCLVIRFSLIQRLEEQKKKTKQWTKVISTVLN